MGLRTSWQGESSVRRVPRTGSASTLRRKLQKVWRRRRGLRTRNDGVRRGNQQRPRVALHLQLWLLVELVVVRTVDRTKRKERRMRRKLRRRKKARVENKKRWGKEGKPTE